MREEIYNLLEAISRAGSLAQLYELAMQSICAILHCNRAAILLFDDSGVMRFVGSLGLSERYRKAVDGHSPWKVGETNPKPIWISDVATASFDEGLREKIRAEGIRALGFVPLFYEGRLLGKFMIYFDQPHNFTSRDTMLAQGIATQLSVAIHSRRADEALRQIEAHYRTVVEQVRDYAIFSMDKQGRPTTWNEGVQRILGFEQSEFINKDIVSRIFTPEDIEQKIPQREFERAAQAGTANNDRWMRRKDGARFWAEGVTTAIKDGEGRLTGYAKVFRDSTCALRTREQLAELKDQLAGELKAMTRLQEFSVRAVAQGAEFGSFVDDLLSAAISILKADKGNVQLLDEPSGALKIVAHQGFDRDFLEFFDAVIAEEAACAEARKTGKRIIVEDISSSPIFKDATARDVLLHANVMAVQSTPLVSREGNLLGIISTHFGRPHRPSDADLRFLDILARLAADLFERTKGERTLREAREQLARYNEELDEKVKERTASLKEALGSLEILLYTIAHDLRAPNRAMQGYANLLETTHSQQLNEEGKFFVKRIAEAALRNEALIRDLLEYGRLSHAELPCQPVDPKKGVEAVLRASVMEVLTKRAVVEVAENWPPVVANESALDHIVANLLANALKYVRPEVPPRVRIYPEVVNDKNDGDAREFVRVCVQDNGIGVPAGQRETIFEPFQRATNANEEGTGMGLAIVRKAVERMGGQAGVEPNAGEGSTFWIKLRKAGKP